MTRIPTHRAPTHPGEMLREEFLVPLGVTQVAAAERLGIPLQRLNEIVRGRRGVTPDTALRLARLLGTSPEFWLNLQLAWDLYHAAHGPAAEAIEQIEPLDLAAVG
jgi:addiction module HigA family antidote